MKKTIFTIAILFSIFSVVLISCTKDNDTDDDPIPNESSFDFIDLGAHLDGSTKVIFLNKDEGWVLGVKDGSYLNALIHTNNGGSSWTTMNTELEAAHGEIKFINSTDGYLIDNYSGVRYTTDKGASWTEMIFPNPNNDNLDFYATASNSTTTVMLAWVNFTSSALFFVSNATHQVTNTVLINEMKYPGHNMHLSETGIISIAAIKRTNNDFKEIAYSSDNAVSWSYTEIATEGDVQGYAWNSNIAFPDDNTGYFTGGDNTYDNAFIYKTSNGGATWAKITIPPSVSHYNFNQISFANATHGLGVGTASVYKTTDGGETWTELSYFGDNYITTSSVSYPTQDHGFICSLNGATDGSNGLYKYTGQ